MKKILLLASFAAFVFGSQAQRQVDLAATMTSPSAGQQIKTTDAFNVVYTVKNVGAEIFTTNDTLLIAYSFKGTVLSNLSQLVKFNSDFKAGDSTQFTIKNLKFSTTADLNGDICVNLFPINRGADPLNDPNMANNAGCAAIDILANTGVQDIQGDYLIDFVKPVVYPNPAHGNTVISYGLSSGTNVTMNVYDMNGRLVSQLVNEKQIPGVYNETISTDNLPSGVYLITMTTGEYTRSVKMVVAH